MTRSLYSCLNTIYFSSECWDSITSLSFLDLEELNFGESNIHKLNSFAISPITPTITTCKVVAGDASGEGLYAAHFSDKNQMVYSRKLSSAEKLLSSTNCECLVIFGI